MIVINQLIINNPNSAEFLILMFKSSKNDNFFLTARVKSAYIKILYIKAMKLYSFGNMTGKLLNMSTSDAYRFLESFFSIFSTFLINFSFKRLYWAVRLFNFSWIGLLVLIVCSALLYNELGWPALIGIFFIHLFHQLSFRLLIISGILIILSQLPITILLGKLLSDQRAKIIKLADERVRVMRYGNFIFFPYLF